MTAKARAERAALSDAGLYRKGTHRQRHAECAIEWQRPFEVAEAAPLLEISHESVQVVFRRLLRDRVVERESLSVYRTT